jgi:hypothetical protein
MNAITHTFYDSASGRITDPVAFLAADADIKAAIIRQWAARDAQLAATFADKVDAFMSDAQVGLAFLTPQLYRIETEVYMTRNPSFDISRFMTVDSSGDMWDVGTLVYSQEDVGQAEFLAGAAFDMPYASNRMSQATKPFYLAGIGYEWNTQEMQRAARLGRSLPSDKARAAKKAADVFVYSLAMTGKNPGASTSEKGWTGFVNNASVPSAQVANDGTGSSRAWADKTPDLMLRDVNAALTAVETATGETHVANTLVLPTTAYNEAATRRVTDTGTTVLAFLLANNVAGESLTILKSRALETAGTSNSRRMVAYDRDPDVIKFHLPGAHQFLPAFQKASMVYEVAGIMNVGGVEIRLPKALAYRDSF